MALQYPLNEETDRYPGWITFTPIIEKYVDASSAVDRVLSQINQHEASAGPQTYQPTQATDGADPRQEALRGKGGTASVPAMPNTNQKAAAAELDAFGGAGPTVIPGVGIETKSIPAAAWARPSAKQQAVTGAQSQKPIKGTSTSIPAETPEQWFKRVNLRSGTGVPITPNGPGTPAARSGVVGSAITLYLPQSINVADRANYDMQVNLGPIGAAGLNALQSGEKVTGALYKAFEEGGKGMIQLLKNPGGMRQDLAGLAATRLADRMLPGSAGDVARLATGVTVNPNTRTLFRNVAIRTFAFQFKLIASSAAEARAIQSIIQTFREELYPEAIIEGTLNVPIGYKFPNKFKIQMRYNGQDPGIHFLDSHLLGVNAVYNPSSMGWHVNGMPSEVDLSLEFGEPRTLHKQDIQGGY